MPRFYGWTGRVLLIKDSVWAMEVMFLIILKLQIYHPLWSHCVSPHRPLGHCNHDNEFLLPVEKGMK